MTKTLQKPVVYLDASFVSHWVGQNLENPREAAWHQASVACWRRMEGMATPVVSYHVWTEIARGSDRAKAQARKKAIETLPAWAYTDAAIALAERLLAVEAVRRKKEDDALHIALAAVHGADVLLSWNFQDIVNGKKLPLIQNVVEGAGYRCPLITSPDKLLEDLP
ncbi:MAG: PIN domain-containing protein [Kiritimatiellae bacterium]|nr:PIN domain-containing protein [Kiritimatiellia bacterium]